VSQDDLFPVANTVNPVVIKRENFIKKLNITTAYIANLKQPNKNRWEASMEDSFTVGIGMTKLDAIFDLIAYEEPKGWQDIDWND